MGNINFQNSGDRDVQPSDNVYVDGVRVPEEGVDYIYDFNTSNQTFVAVHHVLKDMGIDNNKFFLILYDQDLVGVDPRDPSLSIEMQDKVAREVKRNFWYYMREVVELQTEAGPSPFMLHIGNLSAMYLKLLSLNYFWEQPRQTGKTLGEMAAESYFFGFGCQNSEFGFYNYKDNKAKENLQKMLGVLQNLPEYLQFHKLKEVKEDGKTKYQERRDAGKKIKSFENEINGNKVITQTVGKSPHSATTAGRGATQAKVNMDEIGYYRYNFLVWGSASYAHGTAADNAKRAGKPYGVSWTSTPPKMNTDHGKWLFKFVKRQSAKFEPEMFSWTREDLIMWLKKNADKDFFYITYQYYELGYPESWAQERKRKASTIEDFKRDILLMWLRDYSGNPYPDIALDRIGQIVEDVEYESYKVGKKYEFKLYPGFDMAKYKKVVIGVDVSTGMGGDYDHSTMVGIDPDTTEVVFTMKTNEADTKIFSKLICGFVKKFLHDCLIIIERNGIGKSVIDNIKNTKYKKYLYHCPLTDSHKIKGANAELVTPDGVDSYYGIYKQSKISDTMFEILGTRVNDHKDLFKSEDLWEEITDLVDTGRKIQHRDGCYDDLVIAYLFGLYVLLRDENIYQKFGIKKPTPPTDDDDIRDDSMVEFKEEEDEFGDELLDGFMETGSQDEIKTSDDVIDEIEGKDFSKRMRGNNEGEGHIEDIFDSTDVNDDDLFRF